MKLDAIYTIPQVTVPPTQWPVTTDELKWELGVIDDVTDDVQWERLIRVATEIVETDSRQVFMLRTWQVWADRFPCDDIELRRVPARTLAIDYYTGGLLTTLSPALYETAFDSQPARVRPVFGKRWPHADCRMKAVRMEWTAGYESPADVPDYIKDVVLAVAVSNHRRCELGSSYQGMIDRIQTFGFLV